MERRTTKIFEWLRTCPQLSELWSIAAKDEDGVRVVLPQGASEEVDYHEMIDVNGDYECEVIPRPSVFEDFQINCYESYDSAEDVAPAHNVNVLKYEDVQSVCEWIEAQDDELNFPDIGEQIVSVEVNPFVPQIRFIDPSDNTVGYFITVRVRYVNRRKRRNRTVEYVGID